jgi:alanyl-tRNA synthetase
MLGELHAHYLVAKEEIKVGDTVTLEIDVTRRDAIRANHSATHILHKVLREVLGEHVTQKGSLVAEERLRFDFSHTKSVTAEEITQIETEVNRRIRANHSVGTKLMTPENAIKAGAMALFGEKYGDEVRVLSMGESVELCGGTHVNATGDIGLFKITSEAAIAAGIRRIEAVTGAGALKFVQEQEGLLASIAAGLKVPPAEILQRIDQLQTNQKKLEKELSEAKKKSVGDLSPEVINGINFIGKKLDGLGANEVREIAENLRKKPATIIALFGIDGGKISIVTAVSDDLKDKYKAPDLVKIASEATGGKGGGGKPEMAQAGGVDAGKINEAIQSIRVGININ